MCIFYNIIKSLFIRKKLNHPSTHKKIENTQLLNSVTNGIKIY
jgi:hypothetical protein